MFFVGNILFVACKTPCISYSSKFPNDYFVYGRDGFIVDGYATYEYYLVVTDFKNYKIKMSDLIDISNKFLDTLKEDRPVGDIIFLGQPPEGCIPDITEQMDKIEKYAIATIRFDAGNFNHSSDFKKIVAINFWTNGIENKNIEISNPNILDSVKHLFIKN